MNRILEKIDFLMSENLNYKQISSLLINIFYLIGEFLQDKKYKEIYKLEDTIRAKYGITVCFSKRNILNMIKFYNTYQNNNIDYLKDISWNKHLLIMKQNDKDYYLKLCIKNNISKKNLEKIIKKGYSDKYISDDIVFDDAVTNEIIYLKKRSQKI